MRFSSFPGISATMIFSGPHFHISKSTFNTLAELSIRHTFLFTDFINDDLNE